MLPPPPQHRPHHRKNNSSLSSSLPTVLEVTPLIGDSENGSSSNDGARSNFVSERTKDCCQQRCCYFYNMLPHLDRDGARFAMRMSVILSFCTLFVLCGWIDHGFWVYVTVLNVSWFPRLDAASVMEKTMQRWIGTMLGAVLGLGCGFLSLLLPESPQHEIFLFAATAIVVFGVLAAAGTIKIGSNNNNKRIIDMYSYATCLCMLTLGVALLPFASVQPNIWKVGLFRVLNVSIGCCIGAAGSVLLWPRPTLQMLHQKTARQVILAGEAAEAVLHTAVDAFSGKRHIQLLSQELLQTRYNFITRTVRNSVAGEQQLQSNNNPADVALEKYEDAIQDWMASKTLFPLLRFDPFSLLGRQLSTDTAVNDSDIATTLARALRIQTTVVVLDGMIRYDVNSNYNFTDETLQLFTETGTLIRQLLTLPIQPEQSSLTVQALFEKLEAFRGRTRRAASTLVAHYERDTDNDDAAILDFQNRLLQRGAQSTRMDDNQGRGLPMYSTMGSSYYSHRLLFFQLVEHLILRVLRLYHQITETEMHENVCSSRDNKTTVLTD